MAPVTLATLQGSTDADPAAVAAAVTHRRAATQPPSGELPTDVRRAARKLSYDGESPSNPSARQRDNACVRLLTPSVL